MSGEARSTADVRTATLRGLRWIVITRPTSELIAMASLVVCAHLIPPAEFGRFAVAAIVGELAYIPSSGVGAALVQRAEVTRDHLRAGFALALITGLVLVGITFLAAWLLVTPVFGARTAALVRLSTPGFFLAAASTVPSALMQRRLEFRRLSVIDVVTSAAAGVVSISLAVAGLNGTALVLGVLASWLAGTILMWAWAPPPLPLLRRGPAREVLGYGGPAAFAAVSWIGFRNCDYAIVGARLGALQAGLYFRAYTLGVEYQKKISKVMSSVGFPVLARTGDPDDLNEMRKRIVRLLTLLLFPLLALLSVVAPVFIPWLFGHAWDQAVRPTQILALGGASVLVIDAAGAVLMATGRPRALLGYGWAHFAVYGGTVFLVAPWGLTAVAIGAAVVHTVFLGVAYVLMLRGSTDRPLRRLWDDVAPATVACLALMAVAAPTSMALSAAHAPAVPDLATVVLAATAAYLGALRLFFPDSLASLKTFAARVLPAWPVRRRTSRAVVPAGSPPAG